MQGRIQRILVIDDEQAIPVAGFLEAESVGPRRLPHRHLRRLQGRFVERHEAEFGTGVAAR